MIAAVNVTTTAAIVVPANHARRAVIFQNDSDEDMFLKLDSSDTELTTSNGLRVEAGESVTISAEGVDFHNPVWAIHGGAGAKVARVQEIT